MLIDYERLERYLRGEGSRQEQREILLWCESSEENRALLQEVRRNLELLDELDSPRRSIDPAPLPEIVGYRIERELHRGGQGCVYEAWQESTGRPAAIKVLRDGFLASSEQRRRLEREVEVIAGLNHPGIVTVHDSGITKDGRRFFAMELVRGRTLGRSSLVPGRETPTCTELLSAFLPILDAVRYAHEHGVLHRDLKPSNLLVDEDGRARVVDFGLAKELKADPMAESEELTRSGEFLGTLAYAAPEQLGVGDSVIDLRADIYAIGVVLYELLAGERPYDQEKLAELVAAIVKGEVRPPSECPGAVDSNREIDAVVLRAMCPDRDQRYPSVADLAADIQRYLAGEPVTALSHVRGYALRKWWRRRRVPIGLALTVTLAVAGAGIGVLWFRAESQVLADQLDENAGELEEARGSAARSRALAAGLADPGSFEVAGDDPASTEAARERLLEDVGEDPTLEFVGRAALGAAALDEGRLEEADEQLGRALELAEELFDADDPRRATAAANYGGLLRRRGDRVEARRWLEGAADSMRRDEGVDPHLRSSTVGNLALTLEELGEVQEAEAAYREALSIEAQAFGEESTKVARRRIALGAFLKQLGRGEEALAEYGASIAIAESSDHPELLVDALTGASTLLPAEEQVDACRYALELAIEVHGAFSERTAEMHQNLGAALFEHGQARAGLEELEAGLDVLERALIATDPRLFPPLYNLAWACEQVGQLERAEELYARAEVPLGSWPPRSRERGEYRAVSANLHWRQGSYVEAARHLRELVRFLPNAPATDKPELARVLRDYAPRFRELAQSGSLPEELAGLPDELEDSSRMAARSPAPAPER